MSILKQSFIYLVTNLNLFMTTIKQIILRLLYPFVLKSGRNSKKATILNNTNNVVPNESIYNKKAILNTGKEFELSSLKGKKFLIVNTASNCGYTGQYAELQTTFDKNKNKNKIFVIGFPSNDFKQELSNDENISEFCKVNYGVTFPISKLSIVTKIQNQHPIFKWLTNSDENGWCNHEADWNFGKYLIDEQGILTNYFGPAISPLEKIFLEALENRKF